MVMVMTLAMPAVEPTRMMVVEVCIVCTVLGLVGPTQADLVLQPRAAVTVVIESIVGVDCSLAVHSLRGIDVRKQVRSLP